MSTPSVAAAFFRRREVWTWPEGLFWLAPIAWFLLLPDNLVLGAQILIAGLFALSLDLIVGYGGIVSLGHAAFFGLGAYTAGLLAVHGWREPLSGLVAATVVAALLGLATSFIIVRLRGVALLMVTMGVSLLLFEAAQKAHSLTGGDDGLQGIRIDPIFGLFGFDLYGRVAFIYALVVVLAAFLLVRRLIHSPFGLALAGLRENARRLSAIGGSLRLHGALAYTISAALAGLAGGLLAQTTEFVSVDVLGFQRSAEVLIMLILGGTGMLYGGFVGATIFMLVRDLLASASPEYWFFWLGLMLSAAVMIGRGGVIGLLRAARDALARRRS